MSHRKSIILRGVMGVGRSRSKWVVVGEVGGAHDSVREIIIHLCDKESCGKRTEGFCESH